MPAWVRSPVHENVVLALVAARKAAGLTQRDLAIRAGKPQSFVAKIEIFERNLSVLEFLGLARAIGVPAEQLFADATSDLPQNFDF